MKILFGIGLAVLLIGAIFLVEERANKYECPTSHPIKGQTDATFQCYTQFYWDAYCLESVPC